jgi:uncharacterized integral membrane protein
MSARDVDRRGAGEAPAARGDRRRALAVVVLAGVGVLFAVLNLNDVKVNWLFGTSSTPLIIVIAISFLLGAGVGRLAARRRIAND